MVILRYGHSFQFTTSGAKVHDDFKIPTATTFLQIKQEPKSFQDDDAMRQACICPNVLRFSYESVKVPFTSWLPEPMVTPVQITYRHTALHR